MMTGKLVFGMMDGPNRRGRPHREWTNGIRHWRGAVLQDLGCSTLDRNLWKRIVNKASGAYRHGAHGCCWWLWWCCILSFLPHLVCKCINLCRLQGIHKFTWQNRHSAFMPKLKPPQTRAMWYLRFFFSFFFFSDDFRFSTGKFSFAWSFICM